MKYVVMLIKIHIVTNRKVLRDITHYLKYLKGFAFYKHVKKIINEDLNYFNDDIFNTNSLIFIDRSRAITMSDSSKSR